MGGDYKTSADYFQQYDNIRDSLNIEEKAVNVEREKIESSFRDKEQAMELENNKKRLNLLYAIVVLLIISSVLLFLIVRYKNNLYKEKIENELVASREKGLKLELELELKIKNWYPNDCWKQNVPNFTKALPTNYEILFLLMTRNFSNKTSTM